VSTFPKPGASNISFQLKSVKVKGQAHRTSKTSGKWCI